MYSDTHECVHVNESKKKGEMFQMYFGFLFINYGLNRIISTVIKFFFKQRKIYSFTW